MSIYATNWTEVRPAGDVDKDWTCTAVSDNLTNPNLVMLAGIYPGRLYISVNSGIYWAETQPAGNQNKYWSTCAIDSDGSVMLACSQGPYGAGKIYKSTNIGVSWVECQPIEDTNWQTCAIDSDGSVMLAAVQSGRIYRSINTGFSWTEVRPAGDVNRIWRRVSVNYDGSIMLATESHTGIPGAIYMSTDTGDNWTDISSRISGYDHNYPSCDMSSDGSKMIVSCDDGYEYLSSDSGNTWSEGPGGGYSNRSCMNFNGRFMGSIHFNNTFIMLSSDSGVTWTDVTPRSAPWSTIAMGSKTYNTASIIIGSSTGGMPGVVGRLYLGTIRPSGPFPMFFRNV